MTLPTSTTNMTGLPIILRGFSFKKQSTSACRTIFHSQIALLRECFMGDCPSRTIFGVATSLISGVVAIVKSL